MLRIAASLVALVQFITLHGPDGQQYLVNPEQITTLREPSNEDVRHFHTGTHCIIVTTSGKFVAVREDCDDVRDRIEKMR